MKKKIASLITLILCLLCMPLTVFAAETEMVPVVANVPADWEEPHLWAWADDGTNAFAAWPGEAMEELGDGWYYCYDTPGLRAGDILKTRT